MMPRKMEGERETETNKQTDGHKEKKRRQIDDRKGTKNKEMRVNLTLMNASGNLIEISSLVSC